MPSGAASSRRHFRTCAKKTSPAPVSRSPPITVHQNLGGDAALARLRERLRRRGLRLMLDFVPNHMGLDHPWVEEHPEHFITGTELDLARAPQELYLGQAQGRRSPAGLRPRSLFPRLARHAAAQLRQPRNAGSDDRRTVEDRRSVRRRALRHGHAGLARRVRATWGQRAPLFWPKAIQRVRKRFPGFLFMAEVYWDLEWTLQQQGFDYAYDKRLYDRLRDQHARPVREHFHAGLDYQNKLARFLENHDEPRPRRRFLRKSTKPRQSSLFCRRGCDSSIRDSSTGGRNGSPRISVVPRTSPLDPALRQFYDRLLTIMRQASRS